LLNREFLSRIRGPEFTNEVHYLRTWVSRLRAKLDPDDSGELITTFPGIGYRMELPGALA
jgi:two-component system KDP operon response regulator KdpE